MIQAQRLRTLACTAVEVHAPRTEPELGPDSEAGVVDDEIADPVEGSKEGSDLAVQLLERAGSCEL